MLVLFVVVFGGIIIMSLIGIKRAYICPECKEKWALKWSEVLQGDECKYCGHFVSAENFVPPKASYLKYLQKCSPITYKKKEEDEEN